MKIPAFVQTLLTDYFRWTAGATVVVILVLGYVLVLDSRLTELRTSGLLERAKVETDLASQKDYLEKLRASIQKFDASLSKSDLAGIDAFIPTGPDFPGLLLTLEAVAASANLQLDSMNVNEVGQVVASVGASGSTGTADRNSAQAATPAGLNLQTQDVTVAVSGGTNYASFKRFITQLESSRRLLDVVSLNFSHQLETTETATSVPYNVVIRTYYLPANRS